MLEVSQLTVRFDGTPALDGADLTVEDRSIHVLMGPSGSGKSTMLRAIAGLEDPDVGDITWNGRSVLGVPTHKRGFGLMFQDYALFPHRDVAGNVAFGLRMQGLDSEAIRSRVDEVLELVGLPGYGDRSVGTLSGGERQRIALARTLAPRPRLVLLDEPLGALDRSLREHLLIEMRSIFNQVEATVLYVTHDREEAFTIADRVAIIRDGGIVADDTPEGVWRRPPDGWTARFIGLENLCAAPKLAGFAVQPPSIATTTGVIPPEAITLSPTGSQTATVTGSHFRGGAYRIELDLGAGSVLVTWSSIGIEPGTAARFDVDATQISWFED
ncbi:MAG: ABC transporter ATP-binding protein [Actinomycetota bacterium]|nr:ABC transporter ATP-binding protein [Actinomycetota bacterium]